MATALTVYGVVQFHGNRQSCWSVGLASYPNTGGQNPRAPGFKEILRMHLSDRGIAALRFAPAVNAGHDADGVYP
jgi:hypothetical protein